MKSHVLLLAGLVLVPAVRAIEIDGIAARVGSESVLRSDILDEMRRMNAPESEYANVRNQMIDRKLILRAAAEAKMTMQDWVVESRIREIIKKGFDGDRNRLMDTLSRQKVSYPEWRARMKDDMVVSAMRYQVVDRNVSASPTEMRQEYERHPERYSVDRTVTVSVIMLKPEEAARRGEIAARVKDGAFAELGAKTYSDVRPEDLFRPELCKALDGLSVGEVGTWIEIDGWSYLMRKDGESGGRTRSFEEAVDDIEANVREAAAERIYRAWLERLRSETYIKVY